MPSALEVSDENLEATLNARLPLVLAEMRKRIEAVGLVW